MHGRQILITAGPTFAPLDSVRSIVNRSSGKMGCALAEECLRQGAIVHYCAGRTSLTPSSDSPALTIHSFETVDDLAALIQRCLATNRIDALLMAAAVLDYVPETMLENKKSSQDERWQITLKRSMKIIEQIRKWDTQVLIVGFKLETNITQDELIAKAEDLIRRSDAAMVLANRTEEVTEKNHSGILVERINEREIIVSEPLSTREAVARKIVERLARHLR
ncbi:MAG: phosphopantothenoylcysteine decarboxylase [Candidatus Omnitrophota bacterium]|jgi:phosphopantothenoylcysteine synthetase/decarboxylase|nr:MAG: phosphopantothenoylcysteine decarboxylase [Candidatus Omnitrophota bacterium]